MLGLAYLILKNGKDILRKINHNKEIQQREEERQRHMVENRKREHAKEANQYQRN